MTVSGHGTDTHDSSNGGVTPDAGNVDKIRDILFGSQMRDYDKRFSTVEERLLREASALREDLGRRMLATEQYLRGELETLAASLKAEERDRLQGVRDAADALATTHRELADRLSALAEQTAHQQRELRAQLQEVQRTLSEELHRRHHELGESLRQEAGALRFAKADRSVLAAMFAELAERLSSDQDR